MRAKAAALGLTITVDSAGTGGWHVGDPPYGPAIEEGAARGYDLASLRARQIHAEDFFRFDLILGMDSANIADIEALRPAGNTTRVRLMTSYAVGLPASVPDPYYTRDFASALDLIEEAVDGVLAEISPT